MNKGNKQEELKPSSTSKQIKQKFKSDQLYLNLPQSLSRENKPHSPSSVSNYSKGGQDQSAFLSKQFQVYNDLANQNQNVFFPKNKESSLLLPSITSRNQARMKQQKEQQGVEYKTFRLNDSASNENKYHQVRHKKVKSNLDFIDQVGDEKEKQNLFNIMENTETGSEYGVQKFSLSD